MGVALAVSGSFDMLTDGHVWLIKQANKLTDNLTVYIPVNPDKTAMIPLTERVKQMKQVLSDNSINAHVEWFQGEYTATVAARHGIEFLVRGSRRASEFDYEAGVHEANMDIAEVPTMLLIPPANIAKISSSYVKGLMKHHPVGWHNQVKALVPKVVYEYLRDQYLEKNWTEMWHDPSYARDISPTVVRTMFNELCARYSEEHRFYHNLDHITHMLSEIDVWALNTNAPKDDVRALKLAAWYHDSMYEPDRLVKTPSDEEYSELYWRRQPYATMYGQHLSNQVSNLILATDHFHRGDIDERLVEPMLDIDLAILGQPPKVYQAYTEAIRREYDHVTEYNFMIGRAKVLAHFMQESNNLYHTNYFHTRYQAQAVANISAEYEKIQKWLADA